MTNFKTMDFADKTEDNSGVFIARVLDKVKAAAPYARAVLALAVPVAGAAYVASVRDNFNENLSKAKWMSVPANATISSCYAAEGGGRFTGDIYRDTVIGENYRFADENGQVFALRIAPDTNQDGTVCTKKGNEVNSKPRLAGR